MVLWGALAALRRVPELPLVGFFLAAGGGILVIASFLNVHLGSRLLQVPWSDFAYGAWIGLGFGILLVLLGAGWLRAYLAARR